MCEISWVKKGHHLSPAEAHDHSELRSLDLTRNGEVQKLGGWEASKNLIQALFFGALPQTICFVVKMVGCFYQNQAGV